MIKLKTASIEDIPTIQNLAQQVWPVTFKPILTDQQIDYMIDMMYSSDSLQKQLIHQKHIFCIVYDKQDNEIGYVSYQLNYELDGVSKVHKVYVLPNYQGYGYGKQIFSTLFNTLLIEKQTSVILNVNRHNKATEFYGKMGFVIFKEENIDIGSGFLMEDYIMIRPLTETK